MSYEHHRPMYDEGGIECVHCLEPWPCPTRQIVEQVLDNVKARVADMPNARGGSALSEHTINRVVLEIGEM